MDNSLAFLYSSPKVPVFPSQDFFNTLSLMSKFKMYRNWTIADIERLIVPPLRLNQYILLHDPISRKPKAFLSWAYLTEEAAKGYLHKTRKLQPGDWASIPSELWIIDFIALGGKSWIRRLIRTFREITNNAKVFHHKINEPGIKRTRNRKIV